MLRIIAHKLWKIYQIDAIFRVYLVTNPLSEWDAYHLKLLQLVSTSTNEW